MTPAAQPVAPWAPASRQPARWSADPPDAPPLSRRSPTPVDFSPGDNGFIALCKAYRASGGVARGTDLAHWMAGRGEGDSRALVVQIVGHQAFSFDWCNSFWVPMFQLSPLQPAWRDGTRQVLAELGTVLDGWQLAAWFVRSNAWLDDQRPLDLLADDAARVLAAARADRFVITG